MARKIDRNTLRGGAGISAVALLAGFALDAEAVVPVFALALAVGAIFGLRASPLGLAFRGIKSALRLNIPVDPEDEPPPRFAQTLGAIVLGLSSLAFAAGWDTAAWGLALAVVALQTLLAVTGICVGCEMYLFGKRMRARTHKGAPA